jgi:UDP-N-acetylmuramate: L-alanyl-gamma-D-glutamyl-meso-diaminopimelate ligase
MAAKVINKLFLTNKHLIVMKVHFIAIGGSAMHNLAIALKISGYEVSGSDDEIFEPARGRLDRYGLLPRTEGWDPSRIHPALDAVILGMHAKSDNPELAMARHLGLNIYSYPEYLYEVSQNKIRIVIAGSHGKTTITSMVLHVLQKAGIEPDYMVGAQLEGFEVMVRLTDDAGYIILEGDEYLSSTLDPRPKFHLYHPQIALLSGIAWDHMNVFPTFENYISQFEQFVGLIRPGGTLIYCNEDQVVRRVAENCRNDIFRIPYGDLSYIIRDKKVYLNVEGREVPLNVFGRHNLLNVHGAWKVCQSIGLDDPTFLAAISTFQGASKRLQLLKETPSTSVYKDFAHSPSKLKATVEALKELFPSRRLVACLELHTYSSLNRAFLPQYQGCMASADLPLVYFSPHAIQLKRLPSLEPEEVRTAFSDERLLIFNDPGKLEEYLLSLDYRDTNLLMMSSGNFDGIDLELLARKILEFGI